MKKTVLFLVLFASLATWVCAQPAYINYQGRLLDAAGQPLANGPCTLEFNLYDSPTGTNRIWGPFRHDGAAGDGHGPVAMVANGRFNVILGPRDTGGRSLTNAFATNDRFVEIRVNDGPSPILPRQQFLSAPYSLEAGSAQLLNHLSPEYYLNPPGIIVPFAGTTNTIPAGWLPCDGRAYFRTNYPALFAAIGTNWGEDLGHVGTYFCVPDLRGMFLRGESGARNDLWQDGAATSRTPGPNGGNSGNRVGSLQANDISVHSHRWATNSGGGAYTAALLSWRNVGATVPTTNMLSFVAAKAAGGSGTDDDSWKIADEANGTSSYTDPFSTVVRSGETRPNNAYVNYIIKY